MGMIPDFACCVTAPRPGRARSSTVSWRWAGPLRQKLEHYEKAYLVLAGLATLLVFTVSSIVGLDFSVSQIAGWHATIFPLYFVAGAVFCGSA